jgi:DNA repair exonuclease SbcCD ATPase subunit
MVPQKVTLENFLSYREKQELEFADFDLCMLSGPNGSGKSSVFDAVTFALFGEHRAGASSFDDLINKQADAAAVEFEFLLDGRRWQARRTIRRKRTGGATCTMQLNQWSGQRGGWEAVPETSTQRGFNSWVRHHVGLTIETFTSSMLLRQGESDRLISAKAPERFKVLAGIVELERYQKLEERANDQRKKASARCDALDGQLRVVAAVTDHELRLAAEQAVTATQTVALADQGIVEFQSLLMHAGQWEQIGAALHAARTQHDGYKRLLEQAEKIKLEFLRLSDLRQTLPHLRAIADQCRKLAESQAAAKAIGAERAATQEALEHLTQQEADARAALEKLQADIADAETKRHAGSELLAMLKTSLTIAETFAHQRAALAGAEAELAKLPGDPSGDLAAARARRDDANSVRLALPILVRFDEHRRELIRLRGTLPELTQARQATLDKLEAHGAGEDALQRQLKSAAAAVERAQKDDSDAAAHVKVAREALRKISDLGPDAAGTGCPT